MPIFTLSSGQTAVMSAPQKGDPSEYGDPLAPLALLLQSRIEEKAGDRVHEGGLAGTI